MQAEPFTVDIFRQLLEKRHAETTVELIEAGRVRDYLGALDEPTRDPELPVPPLFLITLGRHRRPHLAQKGTASGGVNASDKFEFFAPVYIGDTITVSSEVKGIENKRGRSGELFIATVVTQYRNQHARLVAQRTNALIRRV